MAEEQLLERHADTKTQRAPAQASDGTGGDLKDARTFCREPQLGVDGSVHEAQRPRSFLHRAGARCLDRFGMSRRRHVQRLLEVRTVERIGLVEDRQDREPPVGEQSFQRHLRAR